MLQLAGLCAPLWVSATIFFFVCSLDFFCKLSWLFVLAWVLKICEPGHDQWQSNFWKPLFFLLAKCSWAARFLLLFYSSRRCAAISINPEQAERSARVVNLMAEAKPHCSNILSCGSIKRQVGIRCRCLPRGRDGLNSDLWLMQNNSSLIDQYAQSIRHQLHRESIIKLIHQSIIHSCSIGTACAWLSCLFAEWDVHVSSYWRTGAFINFMKLT